MGSPAFYRQVRAAFTQRGTSLNSWCIRNQVVRQYAENVLRGKTNGPGAKTLARKIARAAGLDADNHTHPRSGDSTRANIGA